MRRLEGSAIRGGGAIAGQCPGMRALLDTISQSQTATSLKVPSHL